MCELYALFIKRKNPIYIKWQSFRLAFGYYLSTMEYIVALRSSRADSLATKSDISSEVEIFCSYKKFRHETDATDMPDSSFPTFWILRSGCRGTRRLSRPFHFDVVYYLENAGDVLDTSETELPLIKWWNSSPEFNSAVCYFHVEIFQARHATLPKHVDDATFNVRRNCVDRFLRCGWHFEFPIPMIGARWIILWPASEKPWMVITTFDCGTLQKLCLGHLQHCPKTGNDFTYVPQRPGHRQKQ